MKVNPQLGVLEGTGLIKLAATHPELEYLFRHILVQDAAYESLLKQDRRRIHAAVGEALAYGSGAAPPRTPPAIARARSSARSASHGRTFGLPRRRETDSVTINAHR